MTTQLNEGLDYHDLKGIVLPKISVDEYAAKMGDDSDIVTLAFTVSSRLAAEDLVSWLEKGYDFILDASVSDGEVKPGHWLVFAELKRRSTVPKKICDILSDLKTLSDLDLEDWRVKVNDDYFDADENVLKQQIILNPSDYKTEETSDQEELNEFRKIAGLENKNVHNIDEEIRKYIQNAGL